MASNASCFILFSDGSFGSLRGTLTAADSAFGRYGELTTEGGDLNQTAGVSVGQAFSGKTAVAAVVKVSTDNATTAALCAAYFENPDGSIACPIQGGGVGVTGLPKLVKNVRMQTGLVVKACLQDLSDAATKLGTLAVYTSSGKCDVFAALGVDSTPTAMVNAQGATIGQALSGQTIVGAYATYAATNGLDDNDDGVNAFYVEDASGQLKAMYPPAFGGGGGGPELPCPYIRYPVRIQQNDTLSICSSVA